MNSRKEMMDEVEKQRLADLARTRDAGKIILRSKLVLTDDTESWILTRIDNKWSIQYKGQRNLRNISLEFDKHNVPTKIIYECVNSDTITSSDQLAALRNGLIPMIKFCKTIVIDPEPEKPKTVEPVKPYSCSEQKLPHQYGYGDTCLMCGHVRKHKEEE